MWRTWAFPLLLAAAAAAQELKPGRAAPAADLAAGATYEWTSPGKRPYWYRLPREGPRAPDLVVMLHGTGLDHRWAFWNYPIHAGHFRPYDLVLAPEAEKPDRGFLQGKADRDEVASLVRLFRKTFPVRNVYLYGHSQGAFFCYYFAGEEPDMVDGVVAHAGNFFKAKFAKAARDRVAIGILHGRADAVVSVDCAFSTDLLYRDAGYRHVRLMVVDGLTEQSGHWPLPWHAARMLAWCDRVAARGPRDAAEAALEEIAQEEPDLAAIAAAAAAGRVLLAEAPPGEADAARERLTALDALVGEARDALVQALQPDAATGTAADGPWAAQFRIGEAAFGADDAWREAMAAPRKEAARHSQAVERGLKALAKGSKRSFGTALDAARKGFLGEGYDRLLLHLGRRAEQPGELTGSKELEAYHGLAPELRKARDLGRRAVADLWAAGLRRFRAEHDAWVAPYRAAADR